MPVRRFARRVDARCCGGVAAPATAQVGQGLADLNAVPEATLATMPGMTPAIASAFVAARPFATIVDANTFLVGQKVPPEQLTSLYEKAFVHINLNTGTAPEILLIPRVAKRMTREFEEYRGGGCRWRSSTRRLASTSTPPR